MAYTNTSPMLVPTRAKSVSGNTNRMARHERKKNTMQSNTNCLYFFSSICLHFATSKRPKP
jgi:hypothetical protein